MNRADFATPPRGQQHWQHGLDLAQDSRWHEAARAFGRATRAAPDDVVYWLNLAHAQRRAGAFRRCEAAARRALQLHPEHPLALRILADCCIHEHRYAEAADLLSRLEDMGESDGETRLQLAAALQSLQRHPQAITVLLRALSVDPGNVRAHALLSDSCRDRGLRREAVECMQTVLALQPENLDAWSRASFEKRQVMDWSGLDSDIARISELLAATPETAARTCASFALLSLPLPGELHRKAAIIESRALTVGVNPLPAVEPRSRAGKAKVTLGFLSFDFRNHPVSQLLVEVLEAIDRQRFEVRLYSSGADDGSPIRRRVQAAGDAFVDVRGLSDEQAAQRIRNDGVDILVDLMSHTRGTRMGIVARRPAPVQVNYLGFPGTSGADFIDYLIGDPHVTPLELAALYTEKLAQMPLTLQPNGRGRPLPRPMTRADAGLPDEAFVMCAFNHTYKILPEAFGAWCEVMRRVPQAVLWLKETNAQLHDNVRRAAAERGVDPDRVIFAPNVAYDAHFSRLALADVFADTWPYNAHTTAADALWAGVPVVTCYGNDFASRVAASALNAAGLAELAFGTVADYTCALVALATEPGLAAGYKAHLVERRMALPLFDTARYTRELEALFARMAARSRAGLAPEHLPAEATSH